MVHRYVQYTNLLVLAIARVVVRVALHKSMFGIAVKNKAFRYRVFAYELLSKVLLLKSYYMFGNYIS
jgi:hypothetical protein